MLPFDPSYLNFGPVNQLFPFPDQEMVGLQFQPFPDQEMEMVGLQVRLGLRRTLGRVKLKKLTNSLRLQNISSICKN